MGAKQEVKYQIKNRKLQERLAKNNEKLEKQDEIEFQNLVNMLNTMPIDKQLKFMRKVLDEAMICDANIKDREQTLAELNAFINNKSHLTKEQFKNRFIVSSCAIWLASLGVFVGGVVNLQNDPELGRMLLRAVPTLAVLTAPTGYGNAHAAKNRPVTKFFKKIRVKLINNQLKKDSSKLVRIKKQYEKLRNAGYGEYLQDASNLNMKCEAENIK